MRAYTHGGWAHRHRVSTTFMTRKNSKFFLCSWQDSNPRTLDLQFIALTSEPTRHPGLRIYNVTLPLEMSRIATRSFLWDTATFPNGGSIYRFWLFNETSFSSLLYIRKKYTWYTHTKQFISVVSQCLKQATLQWRIYIMMNALFGGFWKRHLLVSGTLHCYTDFKTRGPILIFLVSF